MGTQQLILAVVGSVIAGLVVLSMFVVQQRGAAASIDTVRYQTGKTRMLSMVEIIERDFTNMGGYMYWNGSNYVGQPVPPQTVLQTGAYDSTSVAGGKRYTFNFATQTDSLAPPTMVQYVWEPVEDETITLNDGTVRQLIEFRRNVGGSVTFSNRLLTDFRLSLSQAETEPFMVNIWDARVFRVRMRAVSPVGKGDAVEETLFDAVYRPTGMTITDNMNY